MEIAIPLALLARTMVELFVERVRQLYFKYGISGFVSNKWSEVSRLPFFRDVLGSAL